MSVSLPQVTEYLIRKYRLVSTQAQIRAKSETINMMGDDTESAKAEAFNVTIKNHDGVAGATDFATAMRMHSPSEKMRWTVSDLIPWYGQITFDAQTMKRSTTGSMINLKESELDGIFRNAMGRMDYDIWSNRDCVLGRASAVSGTTTQTVTLTVAGAYNNFQVGEYIEAWQDAGAGITTTVRSADSIWKVASIAPTSNQIVLTRVQRPGQAVAASGVIATTNGGDHLVRYGDRSATSGGVRLYGIPFFIPSADPSDTVLGVTRNGSPVTSGWRFGFAGSINETIKKSMVNFGRTMDIKGDDIKSMKHCVCISYDDWYRLEAEADSNVLRDPALEQTFGAQTLAVNTVVGRLAVKPFVNVPAGRLYGITFSTWKFYRLGDLFEVVKDDGLTVTRLGDGTPGAVLTAGHPAVNALGNDNQGDGYAMRLRGFHHMLPEAPAMNWTAPTV